MSEKNTPSNDSDMPDGVASGQGRNVNRRDVLLGMSALAGMAYSGNGFAAMSGHDHSKHATQNNELMDAVNGCLDKGRRCIAHCMVSFVEGDTELAKCASKVQEMMAICGGFAYLVASNSSYNKDYAKVCEQVCRDCEKECREHEEHIECKACAEACKEVVEAIDSAFL